MRWSFEDAQVGKLPTGWTSAKTGEGPGSVWKIIEYKREGKANHALAQTSSEGPDPLFNLCVVKGRELADVDLAVDVHAVSGKFDQGGGLVWRYRNRNNYYIARWNPLEDNFRVYKVEQGVRTQLATADVKAPVDRWHQVRAVQTGNHIRCYFDGKKLLDARDDTFGGAGLIGLWSKADAASWFDNLTLAAPDKK